MRFPKPVRPAPARRGTHSPTARRGFTLIEAAMVMVIIGVGVLAMLDLLAAGTVSNNDAAETTTAMTLASSIRELSMGFPIYDPQQDPKVAPRTWYSKEASIEQWDNITDLDGPLDTWDTPEEPKGYQKFNPPINGTRKKIDGHDTWAQYVKVETVSPASIRTTLPHDADSEVARVTVKITRDEREVYRTSWLVYAPLAATKPAP